MVNTGFCCRSQPSLETNKSDPEHPLPDIWGHPSDQEIIVLPPPFLGVFRTPRTSFKMGSPPIQSSMPELSSPQEESSLEVNSKTWTIWHSSSSIKNNTSQVIAKISTPMDLEKSIDTNKVDKLLNGESYYFLLNEGPNMQNPSPAAIRNVTKGKIVYFKKEERMPPNGLQNKSNSSPVVEHEWEKLLQILMLLLTAETTLTEMVIGAVVRMQVSSYNIYHHRICILLREHSLPLRNGLVNYLRSYQKIKLDHRFPKLQSLLCRPRLKNSFLKQFHPMVYEAGPELYPFPAQHHHNNQNLADNVPKDILNDSVVNFGENSQISSQNLEGHVNLENLEEVRSGIVSQENPDNCDRKSGTSNVNSEENQNGSHIAISIENRTEATVQIPPETLLGTLWRIMWGSIFVANSILNCA